MLNPQKLRRSDFPIFKSKLGKNLIYLDNAATTQTPSAVLQAMEEYHKNFRANIHRGVYPLSEVATQKYEEARQKIADFIGADGPEEIVFTKGATESLNLLAYSLVADLKKGDEVVLTQMEHHSNLVPWQQLAALKKISVKYIEVDAQGKLKFAAIKKLIGPKTKIVSLAHVSNVLGTINPIHEIVRIAHRRGAYVIVDGAQSVPHMKTDVKKIGCDFLAFSGHKMLGPTGVGVLWGKKELLEQMRPFLYGGDMVKEVTLTDATWNELPWKFEAGTPPIAAAIGLGAAVDYLNRIGMDSVLEHETALTARAREKLGAISGLTMYGNADKKIGVVSFNVKGVHPHDLATILSREGIAARAGHHCAMPLMKALGISSSVRISFYLYNSFNEIDILAKAIKTAKKIFA